MLCVVFLEEIIIIINEYSFRKIHFRKRKKKEKKKKIRKDESVESPPFRIATLKKALKK